MPKIAIRQKLALNFQCSEDMLQRLMTASLQILQLEMERLSLAKAVSDRASKQRLQALDSQLKKLKGEQADLTKQWRGEKDDMERLQSVKEEIDRVNLEIQGAERDYDLNRAAELKYGTLMDLQKQLKGAEVALEKQVGGIWAPLLLCFACTASCALPFFVIKGLPEHPSVWSDHEDWAADGCMPIITSASAPPPLSYYHLLLCNAAFCLGSVLAQPSHML